MALMRSTAAATPSSSPPSTSSLSSPLWDDVASLNTKCVLMECWGETDSGKSTFALTAPGPIAYIHSFEKIGGLVQRTIATGKEVRPCGIGGVLRGPTTEVARLAENAVVRLERALTDAYSWARTIVVDTHTDLWQIVQLARLGSMTREERSNDDKRMGQLVYGEMNARWTSLIKQYRVMAARPGSRTNMILIGKASDEYKGNSATGRRIAHGQKENAGNCDVRLRMKCEIVVPPGSARGTIGESVYSAVIDKPWTSGELRGFEVPQLMLTFASVMSLITSTPPSEWE